MVIYEKTKHIASADASASNKSRPLSPFLRQALYARGALTDVEIDRFLNPCAEHFYDPLLLPDMATAVKRITQAVEDGESICIFGDYDVDGMCSTAMLVCFLSAIGANVSYYIPSRSNDGYGMNLNAIDSLHDKGVNLIITVDNGISAVSEISYCKEIGIDVIITDHHLPPEYLPDCCAIVCHTLPDSQYPEKLLCGAGVVFKLIHAISGIEDALEYISLAALATVADVVPLRGENRIIAKLGVDAINRGNCCRGLSRLIESIPGLKPPINSYNLGFSVAPRLNASGRMSDAALGVELFLSDSPSYIDNAVSKLNALNEMRQNEEAAILSDAVHQLKSIDISKARAIILASSSWNPGVIGIAASRIAELYHRPTILFSVSGDELKGSARSIDGVSIYDALKATSNYFLRFGGHAKAAGLTMKKELLSSFTRSLNEYLSKIYPSDVFIRKKYYEFDVPVSSVTPGLVREMDMLAPFGEDNPAPVFHSKRVSLHHLRRIGQDGRHLKMEAQDGSAGCEAVFFSAGRQFDRLLSAEQAEMLFTPYINTWNGREALQLRVSSAKPELPLHPDEYIDSNISYFCRSYMRIFACSKEQADNFQPEMTCVDFNSIAQEYISGSLILVSSPTAAVKILNQLRVADEQRFDVCIGAVCDDSVCANTILLAADIDRIPPFGFRQIIFYDFPAAPSVFSAIRERCPDSDIFINENSDSDYSSVCKRLSCDRSFFVSCYKKIVLLLSKRSQPYDELIFNLSKFFPCEPYSLEFPLLVFMELGFIAASSSGSLAVCDNIGYTSLNKSRLYRAVFEGKP